MPANYCTVEDVKNLLPTTITVGSNKQTSNTLQVTGGRESVTPKLTKDLIRKASQHIDAQVSPVYLTPLRRVKMHEELLTADFTKNSTTLNVRDNGPFAVGSRLRISDTAGSDFMCEVEDVPDSVGGATTVTVAPAATGNWRVSRKARVAVLEYPDPIGLICARLVVQMIIDRIFQAEQAPDVSKYGDNQKKLAEQDIDRILQGVVRLYGQEHRGTRFGRYSLMNALKSPAQQFNTQGNM